MNDEEIIHFNDQLILIQGFPSSGKSYSFKNIPNQERWVHMNTESGKRLPFKNRFNSVTITDPLEVFAYFDMMTNNIDEVDGVIIDSLTFLMEMFESLYIHGSRDSMKGWANFQQFFKKLMQQYVAKFPKPVIFTAHLKEVYDESLQATRTMVPVKGALKDNGIEAYFSTIVEARRVSTKELANYKNPMLTITPREEMLKVKNVFQTLHTAATIHSRIRSPDELFADEETYINNDAYVLLQHLQKYYE